MRLAMLACFLLVLCIAGCLDFQEVHVAKQTQLNAAPIIDKKFVSPSQSSLLKPFPIGTNCRSIEFKIPPIQDGNRKDRLYYLWFFDGILLPPYQSTIEAENRAAAIVTQKLDRQAIEDAVGQSPLDPSFFQTSHLIDFVIGDRKYAIPENRYFDDPDAREDAVSWTIWFTDTPCSQ
jgi:hypothetical protein